jgi:hypothetical protein
MSAFLCSNRHLNAILTYAVDRGLVRRDDAALCLEALWLTNARALIHRYGAHTVATDLDAGNNYRVERVNGLSETAIAKLCDCYAYQSCENEAAWDASSAKRLIERIRNHALDHGGTETGPAYNAADWCICD